MNSFDRVPPRRAHLGDVSAPARSERDPAGRAVLFSDAPVRQPPLTVTIRCSRCGVSSVVTPAALPTLAVPSVHVPWLRLPGVPRGYGSWMRCPSCRRRSWVGLTLHL